MTRDQIHIEFLVKGRVEGPLLILDEPVSFWGGVDIYNGKIIEANHPQNGQNLSGTILVIDRTKGSTAGSGALLELIHKGHGPAAILMFEADPVPVAASKAASAIGCPPMPVALLYKRQKNILRRLHTGAKKRWIRTISDQCGSSILQLK